MPAAFIYKEIFCAFLLLKKYRLIYLFSRSDQVNAGPYQLVTLRSTTITQTDATRTLSVDVDKSAASGETMMLRFVD